MNYRHIAAGVAALLSPGVAQAHDAFGDLGPFYGGLLHPLVDPAQGLILIALAVLLARQPRGSVRIAYVAIVVCVSLAAFAHMFSLGPVPGIRIVGLIVAALGILALAGLRLPVAIMGIVAGFLAAFAGFAGDVPEDARAVVLSACGTALGVSLLVLLIWAALDLLQARLGRVAGAVAGSWVAAIGIMATALPTFAT